MGERAGGKLHAREGTGEETGETGLASELLSCQDTYATSCGSHRHSCATIQGLLRGAAYGISRSEVKEKEKNYKQMSVILLIFEGGEVDKFAHGTSVPCRARDIFDHSFRSQSKGNLLSGRP